MKKASLIALSILWSGSALTCTDLPGLEHKMMKSKASAGDILVSTMNRLGYGVHSRSWLNKKTLDNIQRSHGKRVAVSIIANELRNSFRLLKNQAYYPYRSSAGHHPTMGYINPYRALKDIHTYRKGIETERDLTGAQVLGGFRMAQQNRKMMDSVNLTGFNAQGKLVHAWYDHFNVDSMKSKPTAHNFEVSLMRKSCGTFADMLKMTARHPAMLVYLDNARNTRERKDKHGNVISSLNENYGREIVELHTLGTGPIIGYDKNGKPRYAYFVGDAHKYDEVLEATKVLSGFGYDWNTLSFRFTPDFHERGEKVFPRMFGKKMVFKQGYKEGLRFLDSLAGHWRTKWNVCNRLIRSVYGFHPYRGTGKACVDAYGTSGNLSKMYNAIIQHDVFFDPNLFGAGTKTPLESVASYARTAGMFLGSTSNVANFQKIRRMVSGVEMLGEEMFDYPAPTGQQLGPQLMKSSTYVANRIDVFNRVENYTNNRLFGKTGMALETVYESREKKIGNKNAVNEILIHAAPAMSGINVARLGPYLTKHFDSADKTNGKKVLVKSTLVRAMASGVGIRK